MTVWGDRPGEHRALLNPAFLGVLAHDVAAGCFEERGSGLPFALSFLAVPIALHAPTRDRLPRSVATSVPAFLGDHPESRVQLPPVAVQLAPFVREGLRFAVRFDAVTFGPGGRLVPGRLRRRSPRGMATGDVVACRKGARFTGRWFARAGDPVTLLGWWGLRV